MTPQQQDGPGESAVRDFMVYVINARALVEMTVGSAGFTLHISNTMRGSYEKIGLGPVDEHDNSSVGRLASTAASEIANDFPLLHAHSLVGLWGAFEACIDGICESWLAHVSPEQVGERLGRLKVPLGEFLLLPVDDRWHWVVDQLKKEKGSELKKGIGQFESVLDVLGLGGPVNEHVRKTLYVAKSFRNVIAHKGGRADARLLEDCAELPFKPGESIKLSGSQLMAAYTAMVLYAETVQERARHAARLPAMGIHLPPWITSEEELVPMVLGSAETTLDLV